MLGSPLGLILLVLADLCAKSRLELSQHYTVHVESIQVPSDAASVARGQHLALILRQECHGKDLGGTLGRIPPGPLGTGDAPNLTAGKGGLGAQFTDADFVRVLGHGLKPNGISVFIKPANNFRYLSDADLADIIACLRSLPPVDRNTPEPHARLSFMGNVLDGAGMLGDPFRAGPLQTAGPPPVAPPAESTADYGQYLVNINGCRDCHGAQLALANPGTPGSPLAPNLTPGGELRAWTETQFVTTLRTGVTPSGTSLPPQFMPWDYKGQMSDQELSAVFAYLQSLPALQTSTALAE